MTSFGNLNGRSGVRKPFRVLVFPAGTEIGLEIYEALHCCKEVELFGAGQDISNHGPFVYERYSVLPAVIEPSWLDSLNDLLAREQIDFILPAHDDVVVALAREHARIRAQVVSSPLATCEITRSKSATYRRLSGHVRVPRLYGSIEAVEVWPIFAKPDCGQGSQGIVRLDTPAQAQAALVERPDRILCEYLPGSEYTVDCFSDRESGLLFCRARERVRTRNGISVHSRTSDLPGINEMAEAIANELPLHGAWFFQMKKAADGELVLMEVAPRIAGSMAVHRVQGVNFPLLSIYECLRFPLDLITLPYEVELDRALRNRYRHSIFFENVYVDFDDTLLLRGKINIDLVRFVFQCFNNDIPVRLITRHAGDIGQALSICRLGGVFDEVIHLTEGQEKKDYITAANAIFIDDSFSERKKVKDALGIPVLDCSMIELLAQGNATSGCPITKSVD